MEALFAILRERLARERVPFDSDPGEGRQVLGLLESRLGAYENVLVPPPWTQPTTCSLAKPPWTPYCPTPCVARWACPTRTCATRPRPTPSSPCSEEPGKWSCSIRPARRAQGCPMTNACAAGSWRSCCGSGNSGKATFSSPASPLWTSSPTPFPHPSALTQVVEKTPEVVAALDRFLAGNISPSALDDYITCPLRFFLSRLAGIRPLDEVGEGRGPGGGGQPDS